MLVLDPETDILTVTLPQGVTQYQLVDMTATMVDSMKEQFYGKDIQVTGRITTAMAMVLGHKLAHVCKSVSMFDPKLNEFVMCIFH